MTPSQDIDDMCRRTLGDGVPPDVAERLRGHLAAFEVALSARRRAERRSVRRLVLRTAAIAAALLLVGVLAPMLSRPTPTWANVVEQFDAAPFVNAAVYVKTSPLADPVQLEVWLGREGQWRIHVGGSVLFGAGAKITDEVRLRDNDRPEVENALEMVRAPFEQVRDAGEISLDTIIRSLPIGVLAPTPVANQQASVSNDLAVFDMQTPSGSERVRVWALRESRLPVRIRYTDDGGGDVVDVLLSYAPEPAASFYDPDAFRRRVEDLGPEAALALPGALETPAEIPPDA